MSSYLNLHHSKRTFNFSTNLLIKVVKSLFASPKVVSSANNLHIRSIIYARSLIIIKKNRGPNTLPCGTLTGFLEEEIAFYRTLPIDDDQKNSLQLAATPNY